MQNQLASINQKLSIQKLINSVTDNDLGQMLTVINRFNIDKSQITNANYFIPDGLIAGKLYSHTHFELPRQNLTLLHIAAFFDALDVFVYLTEVLNFNIRTQSPAGYLPLHYAVYSRANEVAYFILSTDPGQAAQDYSVDYQLIWLAIEAGSPDVLKMILDAGANIESSGNKRNKIIERSIAKKNIECIRLLLEATKIVARNQSERTYTPIMLAVSIRQPDAIPLLVKKGEDPNTFIGNTSALFIACFLKQFSTIEYLAKTATVFDLPPEKRAKSLIHYVCETMNFGVIKQLIDKCPDPKFTVNRVDERGQLGPHYFVDVFANYITEDEVIQILEYLRIKGLNINQTAQGNSMNHSTSLLVKFTTSINRNKSLGIIRWLLENGANTGDFNPLGTESIYTTVMKSNRYSKRFKVLFKQYPPTSRAK